MARPNYSIIRDIQGNLIAMRSDKLATSSFTLSFKTANDESVRLTIDEIPGFIAALNVFYEKTKLGLDNSHSKHEQATGRVALQPRRADDMRKDALLESRKKTITIPQK